MHCGLFMPHEYVAKARLLGQRVVERQDGAARIAEHGIDAAVDQRLEQHGGAGGGGGGRKVHVGGGSVWHPKIISIGSVKVLQNFSSSGTKW
jgi:hypothetical protein